MKAWIIPEATQLMSTRLRADGAPASVVAAMNGVAAAPAKVALAVHDAIVAAGAKLDPAIVDQLFASVHAAKTHPAWFSDSTLALLLSAHAKSNRLWQWGA